MANYSLVSNASFKPFSMQEMLVPFTAYKDSFEKTEEAYNDLSDKSDKFKYLSETLPEGSKARDIYEGYANNLKAQAEDLAHNGLTMGNNRALTSLKRRYQGEIGRLVKADEAMAEEKKLRQAMGAQDSSRLYATDNLNIDDFLDGKSPNLYSISGKEAYSRGAAAGKAFSSRVVNVGEGNITLGGYYRDLVAKYGYSPEVLNNFMSNMDAIPELKASFENYMESSGANANLSGANKQRFAKEYLSGVLDGAVYQENHSPQRDLGVLTKAEQVADTRAKQQQAISMWQAGAKWDKEGNVVADTNNINYKTKKIAADAAQAQFNTMYIEDPDNEGSYILNPAYASGYSITPKGEWKRDPKQVAAQQNDTSLATELSKLDCKTLGSNGGFEVSYNSGRNRKKFSYIGAIVESKDTGHQWMSAGLGEDNPSHNGLNAWAHMSASNLDTWAGNLTAENTDKGTNMRVLTVDEFNKLMPKPGTEREEYTALQATIVDRINRQIAANPAAYGFTEEQVKNKQANYDYLAKDIEIIEVPREGNSSRKEYLIAVEQD